MKHSFSIIIPTYNEQAGIGQLLDFINANKQGFDVEIIVSDGNSNDFTRIIAERKGVRFLESPKRGRGTQLNFGASAARNEVLYFLHADSKPPKDFLTDINNELNAGYGAGCYRLKFDHDHWFLRLNAWFTRFNLKAVRFGDQSLFVTKKIFNDIGGYSDDHIVLEDQEIIGRIKDKTRFRVIPKKIITSARKYLENGPVKLQYVFFTIWLHYYLGKSQQQLLAIYKKKIVDPKLNPKNGTVIRELTPHFHKKPNTRQGKNQAGERSGS